MISVEHTQSLSDFRKRASETLNRLNQTGEAEIITVNGEARAVLLPPAVYDELARAREAEIERDVTAIRQSMKELDEGKGRPVKEAFAEFRAELLALKAAQQKAKSR